MRTFQRKDMTTILLDIWGTLVQPPTPHPSDQIIKKFKLPVHHHKLAIIANNTSLLTKPIQPEEGWYEIFSSIRPSTSIRKNRVDAKNAAKVWHGASLQATLFPKTTEFIMRLKSMGYDVGLASAIDKASFATLEQRFKLLDNVDFAALSYRMGISKSKGFYEQILKQYSDAIMIGDSLWFDTIPSIQAGCKSILLLRKPLAADYKRHLPSQATLAYSFDEIIKELKK